LPHRWYWHSLSRIYYSLSVSLLSVIILFIICLVGSFCLSH
jgi:high-affinity nickel permease